MGILFDTKFWAETLNQLASLDLCLHSADGGNGFVGEGNIEEKLEEKAGFYLLAKDKVGGKKDDKQHPILLTYRLAPLKH